MRRLAQHTTLLFLLAGCDDQQEVRRLRAELEEVRAERDALEAERDQLVELGDRGREPAPTEVEPSSPPAPPASAWKPDWRKIDLQAARIEFPASPKRKTPTLEEWIAKAGGGKTARTGVFLKPTGSVLQYSFAVDGLDVLLAEMVVQGGPHLSLVERLDGMRAGILRDGPAEIVAEKSYKKGRFKLIRMELKAEGGMSIAVVYAAAKLRRDQASYTPDAITYTAIAVWPTDGEHADIAKRFLDSLVVK